MKEPCFSRGTALRTLAVLLVAGAATGACAWFTGSTAQPSQPAGPPPEGTSGQKTTESGGPLSENSYSSSSTPSPGGSAAPSTYSLSLYNSCPNTVKLFFGDKPKFGSGTYTSLDSNSRTSYSGFAGDMIWIVDDSENGISSYTIGAGSQSLKITSGCTGFAPE